MRDEYAAVNGLGSPVFSGKPGLGFEHEGKPASVVSLRASTRRVISRRGKTGSPFVLSPDSLICARS